VIHIESLHIENFRGIRTLTLNLARKNFGIYGPNGTGKSGIVDAIEFVLTGSVTRLGGRGSGGISVRSHGPHVDFRDLPDRALVRIQVFAPSLNKSFTIERRVSAATRPVITPADDPDILALATRLAEHPELALSRREILKYVIVEAGQRSKEVQALLRLDDVEVLRASLQKIANECKRTVKTLEGTVGEAQSQLLSALKIRDITRTQMLAAVNERRGILGLEPLSEISKDTSLRSGVSAARAGELTPRVKKATASADLAKLEAEAQRPETADETRGRTAILQLLVALRDDPKLLHYLRRRDFLARGLELLSDRACPLCDTAWDLEELRSRIEAKLQSATAADVLRRKIDAASRDLETAINSHLGLVKAVRTHAELLGVKESSAALVEWEQSLSGLRSKLTFSESVHDTIAAVDHQWRRAPVGFTASVGALRAAIAALPDPSAEEGARDYLLVCQERFHAYRSNRRQLELWRARVELVGMVVQQFEEASRAALTALYKEVEKDFSRYYAFVHRDDESQFLGKLTPSLGKLSFDVDFHGKGMFPPGAYHSEGHQDSMGLCLYLALMRRILGDEFRLAVLDDVLMSVDSGHRREVCRLLKQEFPQTQFVFTTHDRVWLHNMVSEGLLAKTTVREFRRWTVDDGPHAWDFADVWSDIQKCLDEGDVPGAAHTLRLYLERIAGDLAARFRARVEFRPDLSHDLGDLLVPLTARFGELLKKAKASAHSWGRTDVVKTVVERETQFAECLHASRVEQPILNPSVHYNEWNNLTPEEFARVAEAFKNLLNCFACQQCGGVLYAEPRKGSTETLRCDCGATILNLKAKSTAAA
jgi:multidrug efflux pump subunit AcrA (membrane-fusion protein)